MNEERVNKDKIAVVLLLLKSSAVAWLPRQQGLMQIFTEFQLNQI